MSIYDCEAMRDLLPVFVHGESLPHERAAAELHLDVCADCAREAELVRLLQHAFEPMPAGLETRVLNAVRAAPPGPTPRFAPARLAMAATVALTLIGGAFALNYLRAPGGEPGQLLTAEFDLPGAALFGWVAYGDPMLHGGATLDELTVGELELLLAELES
ncbi:hypothetical protein BH23GEM10_BH23GEM10_10280 [soil metagenome]